MRMPQGSFVNGSSVAIRTVFVAGFVLKACLACTVFDAGVAVKLPRGSFVNASSTASTVFDAGVALKSAPPSKFFLSLWWNALLCSFSPG